jgi:hypothetical protein
VTDIQYRYIIVGYEQSLISYIGSIYFFWLFQPEPNRGLVVKNNENFKIIAEA